MWRWFMLAAAAVSLLAAIFSYIDGDPSAGREHLAIALLFYLVGGEDDE